MSESNQTAEGMRQDLQFVRKAVEAKERTGPPATVHLVIWTVYSLVCIPIYDFDPRMANKVNMAGFLTALVVSFIMGKRAARRTGEFDRELTGRNMLHWYGGIALTMTALYGLAFFNRGISELAAGQVSIILV